MIHCPLLSTFRTENTLRTKTLLVEAHLEAGPDHVDNNYHDLTTDYEQWVGDDGEETVDGPLYSEFLQTSAQ